MHDLFFGSFDSKTVLSQLNVLGKWDRITRLRAIDEEQAEVMSTICAHIALEVGKHELGIKTLSAKEMEQLCRRRAREKLNNTEL